MSLSIMAAVGVIGAAVWLWRLAQIGTVLKSAALVVAVLAALVFLGIVDIGYNPDRVYELGGILL